jgi:hypothetical protein
MRTMRVAWAVLVSSLALVAAGCGGDSVGAGESSAAELLKTGALVYWETETDPESDQLKQVEELLKRFPDGEKWIAELKRSFERDAEVKWEEVEPALGKQFALAVYATSLTNVNVVGLLNPDDPDETIELVNRLNKQDPEEPVVARKVGDWVALSDKEASLDAALQDGGQALSGADGFKSAMEELPDDSLSRAYFDVAAAVDAFGGADPETTQALGMLGLNELDFAAAWAKARDDGAEIGAALSGEGADKLLGTGEAYSSALLDRVPEDAFAFYSVRGEGITNQFEALRDNPLYAMALREFETELGIKIDEIVALFEGEVAFYAAPGSPLPELALLLDSENPTQARQSADRLLRTIAERLGGTVTEDGAVTTADFEGFLVHLGSVDGAVVLTTSKGALGEIGDKLADSDRFKQALEAAETPDEYTGLAWVDLAEAIEVVLGYAGVAGESIPPEVSRNLEPLRSLVAHGAKDGNLSTSLVFLEIGE